MHLIHNLYLQSIKQNSSRDNELNSHDQQVISMLLHGESLHAKQSQQQADAATAGSTPDELTNPSKVSKTLLDYYRERKDVVVPTAPRMRWMKDTIFKGAQLMHVQVRRRLIYMPYLIFIYIYINFYLPPLLPYPSLGSGPQRARKDLRGVPHEESLRNCTCGCGESACLYSEINYSHIDYVCVRRFHSSGSGTHTSFLWMTSSLCGCV